MGLNPVVQGVGHQIDDEGQAGQDGQGEGTRAVLPGGGNAPRRQNGDHGIEQQELGQQQVDQMLGVQPARGDPAKLLVHGQPVMLGVPDEIGREHAAGQQGGDPWPPGAQHASPLGG